MVLRFRFENPKQQLLEKIGSAKSVLNFIVEIEGDAGVKTMQIRYAINDLNLVISYMNGAKKQTWL